LQSKFKESLFQWRQFSQIFVFLQDALLFYCTLYTDFPGGSTDAVARRVSISQITCCDLFYPPLYTLCLKKVIPQTRSIASLIHNKFENFCLLAKSLENLRYTVI